MGECHLCEYISSIDALILMTRMTFVSHTPEQDKYGREMHRPIPVSSGIRLHLDNLLLYSFSFTLDFFFFFFKSTVVSPHSNLNEELLNYQLCIIVRYDIDSDVCVKRAWEPLQWSCMYSIIYVYHHKNIIYFCISMRGFFFLFVSIFIKVSDIQTQIRHNRGVGIKW